MKQEMSARTNRIFLKSPLKEIRSDVAGLSRGRRGAGSTADGQPKQNSFKDKRSPAFLRGHEALSKYDRSERG
jgi:hypothetical protein